MAGGAIGLRATGSVARRVMAHFLGMYRNMVGAYGISVYLMRKYSDEILLITKNLQLECCCIGEKITRNETGIQEDTKKGSTDYRGKCNNGHPQSNGR